MENRQEEKENLVKKYCPFYSIPGKKAVLCSKVCAWHTGGTCAIVAVAEGLKEVNKNLDGIWKVLPIAGMGTE